MRRLGIIAVFLACVLSTNCSGFYFVGFVSNPGGNKSVTGIVGAVKNGFLSDPTGVIIPFTAVTFVDSGSSITINFCGDQRQWFPLNQQASAEYTTGIFCNTLQNVVINGIRGDQVIQAQT